jgi:hypothetical protein
VAESVASTISLPAAVSGPVLFARYAFPPNHHGYCGPSDAAGFFADGVAGNDHGIRRQARDFDGALPFLKLIAESNGLDDPMDPAVVEAYWLGGAALDRVRADSVSDRAEAASRHRTGPLFGSLREALGAGALPHHSFTVLCVYPWVHLLADDRRAPQAMIVLDRCRIRWGRVLSVEGDRVQAEFKPLTWDGRKLALGSAEIEYARRTIDGVGLPPSLLPGDWVTLHWDWVCDKVTEEQQTTLERYTSQHIALVNAVFRSTAAHAAQAEPTDG